MKTDYSAKTDLKRALKCLEGADNLLHEINFQLDLEWGPDSSSGLATDLASIQRDLDETLKGVRELLAKSKGKLAVRKRK